MNTPTLRTDARWDRLWRSGQSWYQIAEEMKLDCRQLESELTTVTQQRDRLAEAFRKIKKAGGTHDDSYDELDFIADVIFEALQSLNEPTSL